MVNVVIERDGIRDILDLLAAEAGARQSGDTGLTAILTGLATQFGAEATARAAADSTITDRVTRFERDFSVSVRAHGAGTTANDTVAFQKAIDEVRDKSPTGRGTVYIPAGTYKVQGVRFYPGIYFEGAGPGATVIRLPDNYDNSGAVGTACFNADPSFNGGDVIFEYGGFRRLSLIGPGTGEDTTPGNRSPADITAGAMYRVNGIDFKAVDMPGGSAYRLYQWMLTECRIGNWNIGVNLYKNLYDVTIRDNFIYNNMIGTYWDLQHPNVLNNDYRYNDYAIYARVCIDGAFTQNRISLGRVGLGGDYPLNYNSVGTGADGLHHIPTTSVMLRTDLINGLISRGDTVTGVTSGATGTVVAVSPGGVRLMNVVGTFVGDVDGETDFRGVADDPSKPLDGEALTFSSGATAIIDFIAIPDNGGLQRSTISACTFWQNAYLGLDLGYQNRVEGCLFKGPKGNFPAPLAGNMHLNVRARQNVILGNTFFGDNEGPMIALAGTSAATQRQNIIASNWFYVNRGPAIEKTGNGSCPDYQITGNSFLVYNDIVGGTDEEGNALSARYLLSQTKGLILHVPAGAGGQMQGLQFTGNAVCVDGTSIAADDPDYLTGDLVLMTALVTFLDVGAGAGPQWNVSDNVLKLNAGVSAPGFNFGSQFRCRFERNQILTTTTGTNAYTPAVTIGANVTDFIARGNYGWKTEAQGTQAFGAAVTTQTVTHGLAVTPRLQDIQITMGSWGNASRVNVANIGATTFDIVLNVAPGTGTITAGWNVSSRYGG